MKQEHLGTRQYDLVQIVTVKPVLQSMKISVDFRGTKI